ncbi:hypothetical protein Bca4012_102587 [Brassica carinata]
MEPFPSSAYKVLIGIFDTNTKICNDGAPPGSRSRFCSDRAPSYSSRPGSCPDGRYRSRASAPSIFGLVDSAGNFGGNQLLDGSISLSPYTQVRRTICTSVSLRASTRVSSGFARSGIVHHLSGPDRHAHTRTLLEDQGRSVVHREDPTNQLPYALRVYSPADSHTCRLLVRVSRRVEWGAHRPTPEHADAEARREARAADHD